MQSGAPSMCWAREELHVVFKDPEAGQSEPATEAVSDVHMERSALLQDELSWSSSKPARLELSLSRRDWLLWKAQTASFRPDMLGDGELVRLLKVRAPHPRQIIPMAIP